MTEGNIGTRREAVTGGHAAGGHAAEGCCDANQKPRSHDTSRIAWAKLMALVAQVPLTGLSVPRSRKGCVRVGSVSDDFHVVSL